MLACCYMANHSLIFSCNEKTGDARLTHKYKRAVGVHASLQICWGGRVALHARPFAVNRPHWLWFWQLPGCKYRKSWCGCWNWIISVVRSAQWWAHESQVSVSVSGSVYCLLWIASPHACQYIQFNCRRYLHAWSKPQNHYYITISQLCIPHCTNQIVQQSITVHA